MMAELETPVYSREQQTRLFRNAWLLFAFALVLRLWNVWAIERHDPMAKIPIIDGWSYHQQALDILRGNFWGDQVFFQDPLYPYLLAGVYSLTGESMAAVRMLQALFGAVLTVCLLLTGIRVGGVGAGAIAGLTAAVYPLLIYFDGQIMKESLGLLLIGLALWLLLRAADSPGRWSRQIVAGASFALAVMTRGNLLLFAPAAALWLLWRHWRNGGLWSAVLRVAVFTAAVILTIAPVTIRNVIVGDDLVLLTSQGGANFFIGNNPYADGASGRPPVLRKHPRFERSDFEYEAERAVGRQLKPSEINAYWMAEAKRWLRENPVLAARLWWRKVLLLFNVYEIPDNLDFYFYRRYSPVLANPLGGWLVNGQTNGLILGGWGLLLPLAIGGAVLFAWRRPSAALLTVFALIYGASLVAFHIYDRYRLTLLPAVIPLAAGYIACWSRWRLANWRQRTALLLTLVPVALVAVVSHQQILRYSFARSHYILGVGYTERQEIEQAAHEYLLALNIDPNYGEAWNNLGRLYFTAGQLDQAEICWTKAVEAKPTLAEAHNNLGSFFAAKEDFVSAAAAFTRAAELQRDYFKAVFNLGQAQVMMGEIAAGVDTLASSWTMDREAFSRAAPVVHDVLTPEWRRVIARKIREMEADSARPAPDLAERTARIIEGSDTHEP